MRVPRSRPGLPPKTLATLVRRPNGTVLSGTLNPTGLGRSERELAEAIQGRGKEWLEVAWKLARKGNVAALTLLADRGWGRAKQIIELTGPGAGALQVLRVDVAKLSTEQLRLLVELQRGSPAALPVVVDALPAEASPGEVEEPDE